MDQTAGYVCSKTNRPQRQQNHKNRPKHGCTSFLFILSTTEPSKRLRSRQNSFLRNRAFGAALFRFMSYFVVPFRLSVWMFRLDRTFSSRNRFSRRKFPYCLVMFFHLLTSDIDHVCKIQIQRTRNQHGFRHFRVAFRAPFRRAKSGLTLAVLLPFHGKRARVSR